MIYGVRQLDYVPVSNIDEILEIDSMLAKFLLLISQIVRYISQQIKITLTENEIGFSVKISDTYEYKCTTASASSRTDSMIHALKFQYTFQTSFFNKRQNSNGGRRSSRPIGQPASRPAYWRNGQVNSTPSIY